MPGMSGVELAHKIACEWETISVLLVSGKEPMDTVMKGLPPRFRFLHKPYDFEKLASALRALLTPEH